MSSTDDLLREIEEESGPARRSASDDGRSAPGRLARLRSRAGRVFSLREFVFSLIAVAVGLAIAGAVIPSFVPLGGLIGVFVATFGLGLVGRRRYVEVAIAGAAVAGLALFADYLVFSVLGGFGLPLATFGAVAGALVALVGHYFGRDLRTGLTRDLP
ncbi:MAG: hypothetical protein ABEJ23_00160 [Haloarculaceae archaeon]